MMFRMIFAIASVAACTTAAGAQQQTPIKLKVGTLKQGSLTNAWVAREAGIFARNGLDVELIEFRNGNEAISAQRGGHVDIILTIPGTAMTANERGFELLLVSGNENAQAAAPDTSAIIVRKDAGFRSLADLKGKAFAISGTHTQKTVMVQAAMKKAGVAADQFSFVEMPYASHVDALRNKAIDVAASLDPWTTILRNSDFATVLAYDYIETIPSQPVGAWFAKREFVDKNGEALKRFVKSFCDVADYMQADADRARKNIAAYTGLAAELVKEVPVNKWTCRVNLPIWQRVADMMFSGGELQKAIRIEETFSDNVKPYVDR